jgi:hypothetical protein
MAVNENDGSMITIYKTTDGGYSWHYWYGFDSGSEKVIDPKIIAGNTGLIVLFKQGESKISYRFVRYDKSSAFSKVIFFNNILGAGFSVGGLSDGVYDAANNKLYVVYDVADCPLFVCYGGRLIYYTMISNPEVSSATVNAAERVSDTNGEWPSISLDEFTDYVFVNYSNNCEIRLGIRSISSTPLWNGWRNISVGSAPSGNCYWRPRILSNRDTGSHDPRNPDFNIYTVYNKSATSSSMGFYYSSVSCSSTNCNRLYFYRRDVPDKLHPELMKVSPSGFYSSEYDVEGVWYSIDGVNTSVEKFIFNVDPAIAGGGINLADESRINDSSVIAIDTGGRIGFESNI